MFPIGSRRIAAFLFGAALAIVMLVNGATADDKPFLKTPFKLNLDTWVKVGRLSELKQTLYQEITINQPEILDFKWGTKNKKANQGFWRLRTKKDKYRTGEDPYALLATGVAGQAPGGVFKIDLRNYLPVAAPATLKRYYVDVVPRKLTSVQPGATPNTSGKFQTDDVGPWSAPAIINYVGSTAPITQFEFPEVYRTLTFVLDDVVLVEDQDGPGREEYHVSGFVQELFQDCEDINPQNCNFTTAGKQITFSSDPSKEPDCDHEWFYFFCLNPPAKRNFGREFGSPVSKYEQTRWHFRLGGEKQKWPRRYSVTISLLEEDGGNLVGDWYRGMRAAEHTFLIPDVLKENKGAIEDYIKDHVGEYIHYAADLAQAITDSSTASSTAGSVATGIGVVAVWATMIISSIIQDANDDYYGIQVGLLELTSNKVKDFQDVCEKQAGNTCVIRKETFRYRGPALAMAAVKYNGTVDISYRWELGGKEPEIK